MVRSSAHSIEAETKDDAGLEGSSEAVSTKTTEDGNEILCKMPF